MRARVLPYFLLGALALVLGATAGAATTPDLTADSPFLPASNGQVAAMSEGAPIELRGIMTMPDGMRFSIYDTGKKSSTWVRLNERGTPFVVRSYGVVDGTDQVKIDYQGNTLTLGLKAPKIAAMAAQNPGQPGPGGPGGPFNRGNAVTQSVVLNPTPADEAARLQAVVDAVAARRAARNQANQQVMTQPANPAVVPADANQQALRQQQRLQRQQARPPQQK